MVDTQTISIVIAATSIVIATIFDKLRTDEFIETWIEVMYHQEFKDFPEWMNKYGPIKKPNAAKKLFSVGIAYQTIGMLAREKLIDPNLILKENPWAAVETWTKIESVVKGLRETGDPQFWTSFEHLANQIKKYREDHT